VEQKAPVSSHHPWSGTTTCDFVVTLDWHVGHYVKIVLDDIFGRDAFANEIIWRISVNGGERREALDDTPLSEAPRTISRHWPENLRTARGEPTRSDGHAARSSGSGADRQAGRPVVAGHAGPGASLEALTCDTALRWIPHYNYPYGCSDEELLVHMGDINRLPLSLAQSCLPGEYGQDEAQSQPEQVTR